MQSSAIAALPIGLAAAAALSTIPEACAAAAAKQRAEIDRLNAMWIAPRPSITASTSLALRFPPRSPMARKIRRMLRTRAR